MLEAILFILALVVTVITFPEAFANLLTTSCMEWRNMRGERIVRCNWLTWILHPPKGASAVTLGETIFISDWLMYADANTYCRVINHESVHIEQIRKAGVFWAWKYLFLFIRYGYKNHPWEVEAREKSK
jgi:hypothetical protein